MENHSGLLSSKTQGRKLFELFPNIPEKWFQSKVDAVFGQHNVEILTELGIDDIEGLREASVIT